MHDNNIYAADKIFTYTCSWLKFRIVRWFSGLPRMAFGVYHFLELGLMQGLGFMLAPLTPLQRRHPAAKRH